MASPTQMIGRVWSFVSHEAVSFLLLSCYLFLIFSSVLFYRAAIERQYGVDYAPFGAAAINALLIAKFIMAGQSFKFWKRALRPPLIVPITVQSGVVFLVVVSLMILERGVDAKLHGRSIMAAIALVSGRQRDANLAGLVILLLSILPVTIISVFGEYLGNGAMRRLLLNTDRAGRAAIGMRE